MTHYLTKTVSYLAGGFIGGCAVAVAVTALTVLREQQQRKQTKAVAT